MSDSSSETAPPASGKAVGIGIGLGIALVVLGIGFFMLIGFIGILAAIAVPNFVAMQLKSKRAEVPGNVDGIKTAQRAYEAAYDGFIPVGSEAEARRSLTKAPHPWIGGGDWETIDWQPVGDIRGGYWVTVDPNGRDYTVHGLCDVDGDGQYAEYVATMTQNATLVTDPDIY